MPEIVFVGTGDAFGSGGRRNSAILVREGPYTLLLDCGPTTLGGLNALGIDPLELDAIAISHYHGDHFGGLPFLLIDYVYEHPRKKPLQILGPRGIEARIQQLTALFEYDNERPAGFPLAFTEFDPQRAQRVLGFELETFPAHHHPRTEPHMLAVHSGGRRLFFTGDTGWMPSLPEQVGEADLLIAECVFLEENFEYHLSHERLEAEHARFRCSRTILTHLGSQVLDNTSRTRFELAADGLRVSL